MFENLMLLRKEFVYLNGKELNADLMKKMIKNNYDKIYLIDEAESISNDYYVKKELIDNDIRFVLSLEKYPVSEKDFQDIMYTVVNV
ncbi:hypothetical protein E1N66_19605 [Pantoea allii]|nr:hypothetical protein E1N66_19605 [Pantoea allii]